MISQQQNPYRDLIAACERCLVECYNCIDRTDSSEACHHCLRTSARMLLSSIRLMKDNSPLATRYLVDCAEVCDKCATCCEGSPAEVARQCAATCRSTVAACQRGSLIDV